MISELSRIVMGNSFEWRHVVVNKIHCVAVDSW